MSCPQCEQLRRQVAELQGEVEEWRRQDRDGRRDEADHERLSTARRALGLQPSEARVLLHFLDHPGRLIGKAVIFGLITKNEDADDKCIGVRICGLRAKLLAAGLDHGVTTFWGQGYTMSREAVAAARDRLFPAAPE